MILAGAGKSDRLLALCTIITANAQIRRGSRKATGERAIVEHGGKQRYFCLYVPANGADKPRPLLVMLHGGSGNAEVTSGMGFTRLAERENFVVIYPETTNRHWNDARTRNVIVDTAGDNDDVGFISASVDEGSQGTKDRSTAHFYQRFLQ
ncbi:MAG: poly(3-hydroxybutyrate) depolymerase [Verrucomicrobiales bacterium]|jgi:poly(3-hydroxybutyrate) depolymerase